MKRILSEAIYGIGFGAFAYLMLLLFKTPATFPSQKNILTVIVMSALIGMLSEILQTDNFPIVRLLLHFGLTLLIVLAATAYEGKLVLALHSVIFWLIFITIYVFVWIVLILMSYLRVKKINETLAKRNHKKQN
ncbi:DUF3021 family protein [Lactobacillus sp. ESL0791]|uniref:DUF3021 family protein n=1 Tax=Lactobacillus sp. ESL0791 TaxID=2983234 RepID=UPI0023F9DE13|nr:DUF3021 family protein [Lactobacillus sp. ESL0791]MDF7638410.1 DUF3021 family protein [Lactobacillus sp. ESL0791]